MSISYRYNWYIYYILLICIFRIFREHFTTCLHITFIMLDSSSIFLAENMYITLLFFPFTSYRCKITLTTKECLHVGRVVNITCCWFEYYVEKEFSGSRGTLSCLLYIKTPRGLFCDSTRKTIFRRNFMIDWRCYAYLQ